jgi:uncharacterized protein (TIGR00645 family)
MWRTCSVEQVLRTRFSAQLLSSTYQLKEVMMQTEPETSTAAIAGNGKSLSRMAMFVLFTSRYIFLICLLGVLAGTVASLGPILANIMWQMLFHQLLMKINLGQEILPVMEMLDFMMLVTVLNKVVIGSYHVFFEKLDVEHPWVPDWVKHADAFYVKGQIMLSMAGVSATLTLSDLVQGASSERLMDDMKVHFTVLATAAVVLAIPQTLYARWSAKRALDRAT